LRVYDSKGQLADKTKKEYNLGKYVETNKFYSKSIIVENGQDFYQAVFKLKTSTFVNEQKLKKFEFFLKETFFDDQQITLITNEEDKVLNIKIGNETEQPIHNLGDGLQMLIILTFGSVK